MNMYMGNDSLTQVSIYRYSRIDKNTDKGRDKDKDKDRGRNGCKDMHMHIKIGYFDFLSVGFFV